MKLIFTRKGAGFVLAGPDVLFLALCRSAVDGKPVLGWMTPSRRKLIRPLGGAK